MKVAVVGQFPPPVSGASWMTEELARWCAAAGPLRRLDMKAGDGGAAGYACRRLWAALAAAVSLWRQGPAIVHLSIDDGWGMLLYAPALLVARARKLRRIVHHHSFRYVDSGSWPMRLLLPAFGGDARHVFLCGCHRARFERRWGALQDGYVLGNAWSVATVPKRPATARGTGLNIGLLSNLTLAKGVDLFIGLMRAGRARGLPITGHLAGPLVEPTAAELVQACADELGQRLVVHGPVYGSAKARFFQGLDCFVLPTRHVSEAQPLVLLEAMAAGCAVLTVDRGCIGEDLAGAGVCLPPGEGFAGPALAQLAEWATQPELLAAAQAQARERFDLLRRRSEAALAGLAELPDPLRAAAA